VGSFSFCVRSCRSSRASGLSPDSRHGLDGLRCRTIPNASGAQPRRLFVRSLGVGALLRGRAMSTRFASLFVGLTALCCSVAVLGDTTKPAEVKHRLSPDRKQIAIAFSVPGQTSGRLYYFNNDASRLCYRFTVSGQWIIGPATGLFSSKDRRDSLGQSADSADDLGVEQNASASKLRQVRGDGRSAG
jgi:hypothetical protein